MILKPFWRSTIPKTELQINGDVALPGASAGAHISLLYAATINTNSLKRL
jgi:acetyl esterase/lipase